MLVTRIQVTINVSSLDVEAGGTIVAQKTAHYEVASEIEEKAYASAKELATGALDGLLRTPKGVELPQVRVDRAPDLAIAGVMTRGPRSGQ